MVPHARVAILFRMDDGLRRSAAWFLVTWEWILLFAGILAIRLEVNEALGDARQVPLVLALGCAVLSLIIVGVALRLGGKPVRVLALLGLLPIGWIVFDFSRRAGEAFS